MRRRRRTRRRRRAEAGDHEQIAAIGRAAPSTASRRSSCHIRAITSLRPFLRPISRCESSTATADRRRTPVAAAAATISSDLLRPRRRASTVHAHQLAARPGVAWPIGTCQGLNSAHSPRMVTSVRQRKAAGRGSESMLMQLPTPLDCISSTARCAAEPGAGGEPDAFLLGGQHGGLDGGVAMRQLDQAASGRHRARRISARRHTLSASGRICSGQSWPALASFLVTISSMAAPVPGSRRRR